MSYFFHLRDVDEFLVSYHGADSLESRASLVYALKADLENRDAKVDDLTAMHRFGAANEYKRTNYLRDLPELRKRYGKDRRLLQNYARAVDTGLRIRNYMSLSLPNDSFTLNGLLTGKRGFLGHALDHTGYLRRISVAPSMLEKAMGRKAPVPRYEAAHPEALTLLTFLNADPRQLEKQDPPSFDKYVEQQILKLQKKWGFKSPQGLGRFYTMLVFNNTPVDDVKNLINTCFLSQGEDTNNALEKQLATSIMEIAVQVMDPHRRNELGAINIASSRTGLRAGKQRTAEKAPDPKTDKPEGAPGKKYKGNRFVNVASGAFNTAAAVLVTLFTLSETDPSTAKRVANAVSTTIFGPVAKAKPVQRPAQPAGVEKPAAAPVPPAPQPVIVTVPLPRPRPPQAPQ